jgi:hypothetical protein
MWWNGLVNLFVVAAACLLTTTTIITYRPKLGRKDRNATKAAPSEAQ